MNRVHVNLHSLLTSYGGRMRFRTNKQENISDPWVWIDEYDDVFGEEGYLPNPKDLGRYISEEEASEALTVIKGQRSGGEIEELVTRRWSAVAANILFETRRIIGFDEIVSMIDRETYVVDYKGKLCDLHIQMFDPTYHFEMWNKLKDSGMFSTVYKVGLGQCGKYAFAYMFKEHFEDLSSFEVLEKNKNLTIEDKEILMKQGHLLHPTLGDLWSWNMTRGSRKDHMDLINADIRQKLENYGYTPTSNEYPKLDYVFDPKTGCVYLSDLYIYHLAGN